MSLNHDQNSVALPPSINVSIVQLEFIESGRTFIFPGHRNDRFRGREVRGFEGESNALSSAMETSDRCSGMFGT